jgi:hypothetical protein
MLRNLAGLSLIETSARSFALTALRLTVFLHTHSNRFAPISSLFDQSWTQVVKEHPSVEVLIDDKVYQFEARRIEAEEKRRQILIDRHYRYIPDGIQVYALTPRSSESLATLVLLLVVALFACKKCASKTSKGLREASAAAR